MKDAQECIKIVPSPKMGLKPNIFSMDTKMPSQNGITAFQISVRLYKIVLPAYKNSRILG
jgi:multisubunit Na+/H+ antiporter MnhE subunit